MICSLFLISYSLFLIPYSLFLIQLKDWVPLSTYFISAKFNNETSQINCHQSNENTQWSVKRKTKPFLFAGEQKGIVGKGGESCKPTTDSNCQEQTYFRAQHITFFSNSIDDANQQTACNIDDKCTPRKKRMWHWTENTVRLKSGLQYQWIHQIQQPK